MINNITVGIDLCAIYIVLLCSLSLTLKLGISIKKSVLLGIFSGLINFLCFYFISAKWLLIISTIICYLFIITVFYLYRQNKTKFLNILLISVSYTFLLLGILFAMSFVFGDTLLLYNKDEVYKIPFGILLLGVTIYTYLIIKLFFIYKTYMRLDGYMFDISVMVDGYELKFSAYMDSGNMLVDTQTNKAVLIVSRDSFKQCKELFSKTFESDEKLMKSMEPCTRVLKYSLLNGYCGKMVVFDPQKITINNGKLNTEVENIVVGVVDKNFKNFNALLPAIRI